MWNTKKRRKKNKSIPKIRIAYLVDKKNFEPNPIPLMQFLIENGFVLFRARKQFPFLWKKVGTTKQFHTGDLMELSVANPRINARLIRGGKWVSVSQSQTGRSGLSESGLLLLLPGVLPHFLHLHLFPNQLPTTVQPSTSHTHSLLPFIMLLPMLIQLIKIHFAIGFPHFKGNY